METGDEPCRCGESDCAFVGSLATVCKHLRDTHFWPARSFHYGEVFRLELPESKPRFLLLPKEGGQVFVVVMESLPEPVAAFRRVSLACLRWNAAAAGPPHYTCKMSAEGSAAAATGKVQTVSVEMEVPNVDAASGTAVVEHSKKAALLVVHLEMLHGPSKELHLVVAIDKVNENACDEACSE